MPRPTIRNVIDFPTLHEVVGHGRARRPSDARSSQVEVEIVVAPVSPTGLFSAGLPERSVWVGCGEMAALPVGSRWRLGASEGRRQIDVVEGRGKVLSITPAVFGEWAGGVDRAPFFPVRRLADTRCLLLRLRGGSHGLVMLPIVEALRATFGRTSDLLLQLFGGRVADEVRRFQICPELMQEGIGPHPAQESEKKLVRMRFPRAPSRPEAMLAAMVLTDPRLAESFYGVNGNLTTAIGWRDGRDIVVDTTSPIMPGSEIAFEGRWIGRPGATGKAERRLLVTRVLSLSSKPVFHTLEVAFPSSKVDPEAPPSDARARISNVDVVYVRAERDPAPGGPNIEIDVPGSEIVLESGVDFRLLPDLPAAIRPQPQFRGDEEGDADGSRGSAGDAVPGGDRKTRRVTTRDAAKITVPDPRLLSMKATDAAVARMSAKGWKVVYRSSGKPFEDVGNGFEVLVVGVTHDDFGGVEVMVCDGGTSPSTPRALGLVMTAGRGRFASAELQGLRLFLDEADAHFLSDRARAGAARAGLETRGMIRPAKLVGDADAYADAIVDVIRSHLRR